MKRILLSLSILALTFSSAVAQTSFEESEGFTLGSIDGQNGWGVSQASPDTGVITTDYALDGTNSLSIVGTDNQIGTVGAFSPEEAVEGDAVTVSYDAYFSDVSDVSSDFIFGVQSPSQELLTSRFHFTYTGQILVLDNDDTDQLDEFDTAVTFEAGQWYHFDIVHYFVDADPRIEYYMNGDLIYTGALFGATNVEQLTFLNDDYLSTAYVDNVNVMVGTLAVKNNVANTFAIFPNPAKDVLNITNSANSTLKSVQIVDLNGRVVKSVNADGLQNSNINVSELSNGSYIVKITADNGASTSKKFIKG